MNFHLVCIPWPLGRKCGQHGSYICDVAYSRNASAQRHGPRHRQGPRRASARTPDFGKDLGPASTCRLRAGTGGAVHCGGAGSLISSIFGRIATACTSRTRNPTCTQARTGNQVPRAEPTKSVVHSSRSSWLYRLRSAAGSLLCTCVPSGRQGGLIPKPGLLRRPRVRARERLGCAHGGFRLPESLNMVDTASGQAPCPQTRRRGDVTALLRMHGLFDVS